MILMVTVFPLSDHGAIKRRPHVLLQYMTNPPNHNYDLYKFNYSVRGGATITMDLNSLISLIFKLICKFHK